MASLPISFAPATVRVFATASVKGASGQGDKEKGLLDFVLGGLQKDQFFETDPILKKVEEKNGGGKPSARSSVAVPPAKKGGFGGLFAKK